VTVGPPFCAWLGKLADRTCEEVTTVADVDDVAAAVLARTGPVTSMNFRS
jgi:hypothetical protein